MNARTTHASWRADEPSTHLTTPSTATSPQRRTRRSVAALAVLALGLAACGSDDDASDEPSADTTSDTAVTSSTDTEPTLPATDEPSEGGTLRIGAIPDQDPDVLQRQFGLVTEHLEAETGFDVEYVPVTDYQGAVSGFAVGDLDLVWFGGLTGVQARLEVDGAHATAQRDIDAEFTSVFIAGADVGIEPFDDVAGLSAVAGHSLTFGSESSTSGRLMPQHFLAEAGVDVESDITGEVGFSGSHDATIEVVEAGSYEIGALNSQVWDTRVEAGEVDTDAVVEIFRTPTYYDYHWVAHPSIDERFGAGATDDITAAFLALSIDDPADAEILELFGAGAFIETTDENYAAIEAVARDIGAIR